jgi:trimethylamine:corrinoid methyltransferase-like protein
MSEKKVSQYWQRLGAKLGEIEKRYKIDASLCDEILPIVEKIELRARIEEGKKYLKVGGKKNGRNKKI